MSASATDTEQPTAYLLDELTTGLHPSDIDTLLRVLDALVEQGHTVVVIEHDLDVVRHADWLIDLGPGPGRHGGNVLYEGPVSGYPRGTGTPTARALAAHDRAGRTWAEAVRGAPAPWRPAERAWAGRRG